MKYCVLSRQPDSVLKKADEIRVSTEDINQIYDLIKKYPNKTIIYEVRSQEKTNWKLLKAFSQDCDLILSVYNYIFFDKKVLKDFKHFYINPVNSWYDLSLISNYNPCYVLLGPDLMFSLKQYKKYYNIPVRTYVNRASWDMYEKTAEQLICGPWIRPEDMDLYSEYVSAVEFIADNLTEEATLLKVYKEDKSWPGNIRLLIKDLPISVNCKLFDKDFAEKRIGCGHRCMSKPGSCVSCDINYRVARLLDDFKQN